MKKYLVGLLMLVVALGAVAPVSAASLASRVKGRILLQVESRGEAWYVDPVDLRRTYLKDGATAFQLLRDKGLGITSADLAAIPIGLESRFSLTDTDGDGLFDKLEQALGTDLNLSDTDGDGNSDATEVRASYSPTSASAAKLRTDSVLVNRLRGRILLQVQSRGEAWYVNPVDGKRYYLPDGEAAYQIMRYLSLGITNSDLNQISLSDEMSGWKTYSNAFYSFRYPVDWRQDQSYFSPQGIEFYAIGSVNAPMYAAAISVEEYDRNFIKDAITNHEKNKPDAQVTIAGKNFTKYDLFDSAGKYEGISAGRVLIYRSPIITSGGQDYYLAFYWEEKPAGGDDPIPGGAPGLPALLLAGKYPGTGERH